MRNYEKEIEILKRAIEELELEKQDKETQLQRVLRDCKRNDRKRNDLKKKNTPVVDKSGRAIHIGDRVTATTTGKFKAKSGIVTGIKKWVTFTGAAGVKQIRASTNLLIQDV